MPIVCDPSSLASAARCFDSCSHGKLGESIKTYLLCQYSNVSIGPVAPAVPTNIDISDASVAGNTIVTWTNSDVPTSNEVWKSTDGTNFVLLTTVGGGTHTATDVAAMADNTFFYYKVRAVGPGGNSAFSGVVSVSKNVNLNGDPRVTFSFGTLILAYGNFSFVGCANLTTADFGLLRHCTGNFDGNNCGLLSSINLSSLKTVTSFLFVYQTALVSFQVPNLTSVGFIAFSSINTLTSASLPLLQTITGGDLSAESNPLLASLSCPSLVSISGMLRAHNSGVAALSFPLLQSTGTDVLVQGNPNLVNMNFASLQTVGASFDFSANSLNTVSLPALVTVAGDFSGQTNFGLSNLSIPVFVPPDNGQIISFDNCLLLVGNSAAGTGVDGVLRRCALAGLATCDIELNSPGNAAPDATGQVDKLTLQTNGCTVNTN